MTKACAQISDIGSLLEEDLRPQLLMAGQAAAFARNVAALAACRGRFVNVACPACGSETATYAWDAYTFAYVQCDRCETVYMTPRPTTEIMSECWSGSGDYEYFAREIFPATEAARREKIQRPRLERINALRARLGRTGGTLVEVGAGFGTFSELAQQCGRFECVLAIEPDSHLAESCRARGLQVVQQPIELAAEEIPPADIVVAFEVIEHLFDPHAFAKRCRRILNPGGLLVLTCPNVRGFDIDMLGPKSSAVQPGHVNLFHPRSLAQLLRRCGFDVIDQSTPGRLDAELVRKAAL